MYYAAGLRHKSESGDLIKCPRLGRRKVRKGCAFPARSPYFFEATPHELEAEPQLTYKRLDGKAEPYRTVRRPSRKAPPATDNLPPATDNL